MMNSETKRLCGRYLAENKDDFLKAYHIVMDVKETDKSYIMQLIEFNSRYSASHISLLFSKSKRVLLSKKRGGFSIKNWGDNTFTFYPFQAGIPYYFEKLPDAGSEEKDDVQAMQPIQPNCFECESKDCAYNRDSICRFSKVFDRVPPLPRRTAARNLSSAAHIEYVITIEEETKCNLQTSVTITFGVKLSRMGSAAEPAALCLPQSPLTHGRRATMTRRAAWWPMSYCPDTATSS